jgi:hypothetical protein
MFNPIAQAPIPIQRLFHEPASKAVESITEMEKIIGRMAKSKLFNSNIRSLFDEAKIAIGNNNYPQGSGQASLNRTIKDTLISIKPILEKIQNAPVSVTDQDVKDMMEAKQLFSDLQDMVEKRGSSDRYRGLRIALLVLGIACGIIVGAVLTMAATLDGGTALGIFIDLVAPWIEGILTGTGGLAGGGIVAKSIIGKRRQHNYEKVRDAFVGINKALLEIGKTIDASVNNQRLEAQLDFQGQQLEVQRQQLEAQQQQLEAQRQQYQDLIGRLNILESAKNSK